MCLNILATLLSVLFAFILSCIKKDLGELPLRFLASLMCATLLYSHWQAFELFYNVLYSQLIK